MFPRFFQLLLSRLQNVNTIYIKYYNFAYLLERNRIRVSRISYYENNESFIMIQTLEEYYTTATTAISSLGSSISK